MEIEYSRVLGALAMDTPRMICLIVVAILLAIVAFVVILYLRRNGQ